MMEENPIPQPEINPYLVPASIIVAGLLIAGAVMYSNPGLPRAVSDRGGTTAAGGSAAVAGTAVSGNLSDDDPMLGNPDAPVTIVEFSDFQCPFCRRLWKDTLPSIKEKYLVTGKAKFVYRDFPLSIHPSAQPAAEGAECANEQRKFWEMHDKIFAEQEKLGQGTVQFSTGDLKRWAAEIGLNAAQFNECLDSGKYRKEVEKDFTDGQAAGVTGTPGTFVNGRLVQGAVPFAQFEAVIEEELKKVK